MESYTFKDRNGKVWDVTLTLAGARRIDASDFSELMPSEKAKGFSILAPESRFFEDILKNPSVLWAMLFAVVKPQVKELLGIDPDQEPEKAEIEFCDGLVGESMDDARDAFWGAIANFFPESKTALLTLARLAKKANQRIGKNLKSMEPKMQSLFDETMDQETDRVRVELDKMLEDIKKKGKHGEKSTVSAAS